MSDNFFFVCVIIHVNILALLYVCVWGGRWNIVLKSTNAVLLVRLKKIYRRSSPHAFLPFIGFSRSAVEESRCCGSCCGFPEANTAMCLFALIPISLSFYLSFHLCPSLIPSFLLFVIIPDLIPVLFFTLSQCWLCNKRLRCAAPIPAFSNYNNIYFNVLLFTPH